MNGMTWSRFQMCGPMSTTARPSSSCELAPQRRLVVLARLLAAARRRPHRDVGELEAHEQHAIGRVEHDGAHGRADPQALQVRLHGAAAYSAGWSGRSSLNAWYIS